MINKITGIVVINSQNFNDNDQIIKKRITNRQYWYMFDDAFGYWREPPISFAVSVCLSVRM